MKVKSIFSLIIFCMILSHQSFSYGFLGHKIIALIAEQYLTETTKNKISQLLKDESVSEVASWADRVRSTTHKHTSTYHYVNIPISNISYSKEEHCNNGCIIEAMEMYTAVLSDKEAGIQEKAEALKFIIHFTGDIHQPLHCGDNHDRGGNDYKVTFLGDTLANKEKGWTYNLHNIWDTHILTSRNWEENEYLNYFTKKTNSKQLKKYNHFDYSEWAEESAVYSRDYAYTLFEKEGVVDEKYNKKALKIIDKQLVIAGYRLANLLNSIFDNNPQ